MYTLIVDGLPYSYSADCAPSIGDVVTLPDGDTVRVVRHGRVYNAEAVPGVVGGTYLAWAG